MKNARLALFLIISCAYLIAALTKQQTFVYITKPLLMPALAWWLLEGTKRGFLRNSILAGLVFSTIGDVLMMFADGPQGALFFLLGLGSFLFTHLCYIGGFTSVADFRKGFLQQKPVWVIPFLAFLFGFVWWLWPGIPDGMRIPVTAYAAVITTMVLSIVNLKEKAGSSVYLSMLAGGLLFMLSDSLIAAQKFGNAFEDVGLLIMITYIDGQYLIVKGVKGMMNDE